MKLAPLAIAALLAAGCARVPVVTDGLDVETRAARLRAIDEWNMRGRLAVDTGERAFQARFRWSQQPDRMTLTIGGPAGIGGFQVSGNDEQLTILRRGEQYVLDDAEIELSSLYGWWLPVTSLSTWLLGLTDERYPGGLEVGIDGAPTSFEQRLWRVEFSEYQLASELLVPRRIRMTHDTLKLDLTVDEWQPAAIAAAP